MLSLEYIGRRIQTQNLNNKKKRTRSDDQKKRVDEKIRHGDELRIRARSR
jgi:hypothetical protein